MHNKLNSARVLKVGISISVAILVILSLVGVYRDSTGEKCSGFMGNNTSCVEETIMWPVGLIAFPSVFFLASMWAFDIMNKSSEKNKPKNNKSKK
jgi:hypothetical protein